MNIIRICTDRTVGISNLKLVSRVSLFVMLASVVLLLAVGMLSSQEAGVDYAEVIHSHTITRENLGSALVIGGLLFLFCVAAVSWVVALFASFRVAGPLFRFSRNLELASESRQLIGIREGDCFHDVADQLEASVQTLHQHYDTVGALITQAEAQLEEGTVDSESFKSVMAKLRERVDHVQIN